MDVAKKLFSILTALVMLAGMMTAASGEEGEQTQWDYEADVVVVGAGGSGLPAGLKALEDGASVIMVEANYDCGGHAAVSEGQLHSGGYTVSQKEWDVTDSSDRYYYDHTRGFLDSRYNDREVTRSVANSMAEAYEFVLKKGIAVLDIEPMIRAYYRDGGYDADGIARMTYVDATEWENDITGRKNNGIGVTRPLEKSLRDAGVPFLMNYHMDTIVREAGENGKVQGIVAHYSPTILPGETEPLKGFFSEGNIDCSKEEVTVKANKAVIICTGGSIGNVNFRTMFDPRLGPEFDGLAGMPFSDQDASGELAAMKIGAALGSAAGYIVDDGGAIVIPARMGCQYGYGNGFDENSKVWKLFRSRGIVPDYTSMIVVNMLGQRCGNEDLLISSRSMPKSYEYFDTALCSVFIDADGDGNAECYSGPLWGIFDQEAAKRNDWDMDHAVDYENGYAFKADTIEELAEKVVNKYYENIKMDPEILKTTIERFNAAVDSGHDEDWERTTLEHKIEKGPFYAVWATPNLHDTLAGLRVNKDMQVRDLDGNPIPCLFAAGESAGGMHVHGLGRVITSGYIAGRSAASVDENGIATADTSLKPEYAGLETNDQTKTDSVHYFDLRGGSSATMMNSQKQEELRKIAAGEKIDVLELSAGKSDPNGTAGAVNYIGTSDNGMGGAIKVEVIVFNGQIVNIIVIDHHETAGIGDVALEKLVAQAKEKKSADVDIVTGASITSAAFIEALTNALDKIK
jgi:succinate dehydrogenase/fumarate reductase flavoprotein subunit/uncharacterized protein with FMN-binding domain